MVGTNLIKLIRWKQETASHLLLPKNSTNSYFSAFSWNGFLRQPISWSEFEYFWKNILRWNESWALLMLFLKKLFAPKNVWLRRAKIQYHWMRMLATLVSFPQLKSLWSNDSFRFRVFNWMQVWSCCRACLLLLQCICPTHSHHSNFILLRNLTSVMDS